VIFKNSYQAVSIVAAHCALSYKFFCGLTENIEMYAKYYLQNGLIKLWYKIFRKYKYCFTIIQRYWFVSI